MSLGGSVGNRDQRILIVHFVNVFGKACAVRFVGLHESFLRHLDGGIWGGRTAVLC